MDLLHVWIHKTEMTDSEGSRDYAADVCCCANH